MNYVQVLLVLACLAALIVSYKLGVEQAGIAVIGIVTTVIAWIIKSPISGKKEE